MLMCCEAETRKVADRQAALDRVSGPQKPLMLNLRIGQFQFTHSRMDRETHVIRNPRGRVEREYLELNGYGWPRSGCQKPVGR